MKINEYDVLFEKNKPELILLRTHEIDIEYNDEPKSNYWKLCILNDIFAHGFQQKEHMYSLAIKSNHLLDGVCLLSVGTETKTDQNYRKLAAFLLLTGATEYIVAHNHPDGALYSSDNDDISMIDNRLFGERIGVKCLGCYVVTEEGFFNIETKEIMPYN